MISSHPNWRNFKEAPIKGSWVKRWFKSRFRYVDYPFIITHRGFGNKTQLVVQGHAVRGMALSRPRIRSTWWKNFISLVKMFLVRTIAGAHVELRIDTHVHLTQADEKGFFEFEINNHRLSEGWHHGKVVLIDQVVEGQEKVIADVEIRISQDFDYGCISDIDDTFLVSHINRFWRKFYLLLTKNHKTRKPFRGVSEFYNLLHNEGAEATNPVYYVSSSEWNLYDFLIRFMHFHKLPKGVLQLKEIKEGFMEYLNPAYKSHDHKRVKIERIFALHPERMFILLGDNGQHDPYIYHRLATDYPDQVKAIYIRAVKKSHRRKVNEVLRKIEHLEIPHLQFKHSRDAIEHARKHGFIR